MIVDEIHSLARDKRGSHLMLSLERLEALAGRPIQRIGLSATQKPIEEVADFLTGPTRKAVDHRRRPQARNRCRRRSAQGRAGSGSQQRHVGGDLRPAGRADPAAPDDADFREHPPAGRARHASPRRSPRRRKVSRPTTAVCTRGPAGDRRPAEKRRAQGGRCDRFT